LIHPLNRPNKNENFLKKKYNWFLFGLSGGKSKQKYFTRVNQKKYFTGENQKWLILQGKTRNSLYYRGKDLLTLKIIVQIRYLLF